MEHPGNPVDVSWRFTSDFRIFIYAEGYEGKIVDLKVGEMTVELCPITIPSSWRPA